MRTIVEPKQHIDNVWGKQRIKEEDTYRMMRYVLRVDYDSKVLLHNVVTGQLVVLEQEEAEVVDKLPLTYTPVMEQLVVEHYLVPEYDDEHQQVVNLRNILWKIADAQSSKDITCYTILPTTACNARCWYCFEQGIQAVTMSRKTANEVVNFIERSCGKKPIRIRWFGGEPTVAAERVDQISQGLRDRGVSFSSIVTTNGYLFDANMVKKAKELWNVTQVTISVDGTEENSNRVKNFVGICDNPYQRIMNNVELLLETGIPVSIRMNFDKDTWRDFPSLLSETNERFHNSSLLMVYPHQINWDMSPEEWTEMEKWLNQKNDELILLATEHGNYRRKRNSPCLSFIMCEAGRNNSVTIRPDGKLVSCPEYLGDDQIKGDVIKGITNETLVASWKRFADCPRANDCPLFPDCGVLANCAGAGRCSDITGWRKHIEESIIRKYMMYTKEDVQDDVAGTKS